MQLKIISKVGGHEGGKGAQIYDTRYKFGNEKRCDVRDYLSLTSDSIARDLALFM